MMGEKKLLRFNSMLWPTYFFYEWLVVGTFTDKYYSAFIKACIYVPVAFLAAYISIDILFKKFYLTDKKKQFWTSISVVAFVFVLIKRSINFFYIYPYVEAHPHPAPFFYFPKLLYEFIVLYFIVFLYSMFYFIQNWYSQQQQLNNLIQEKTSAELELLKSQVQPHFIFNTLNSIYAEAFKKSPETAQQIIKLSLLLEYTLYDSKKSLVSLEDELNYIRNYIDLQKIRIGYKVDISINIYHAIQGICIPPLLLLPLVENSFKHGVNNSISASWVRIDVAVNENVLTIKVENSIESDIPPMYQTQGGLGLNNVKRRLALLYPNKHDFKTYKEENSYLVVLKLIVS